MRNIIKIGYLIIGIFGFSSGLYLFLKEDMRLIFLGGLIMLFSIGNILIGLFESKEESK